ncbi:MAG: hypothetical protein ACI9JZ_001500 [Lentimonas sp.]|jgi:hypothetical protein
MKKISIAVGVLLSAVAASSHASVFTLSGTMDVLQAGTNGSFGTGTGSGTGTISGSYDDATNLLDYSISFSDLTSAVTNLHFHDGAVGVSGGVSLSIPGPYLSSPVTASGVSVSASGETNLLAGNWYVNVHTASFGGGEIRGQVNVTPVPEPAAFAAISGALMLGFVVVRRRQS